MQKYLSPINYTLLLCILSFQFIACEGETPDKLLSRSFQGGYGQLEVGGPFAGAEFHDSKPIPTRLSFYYPVANSLDLSRDYWKRNAYHPLHIILHSSARRDTIGQTAWAYDYGPTFAKFSAEINAHDVSLQYRFGDKLPILAMTLEINSDQVTNIIDSIEVIWDLSIRTSHAFRWVTDISPVPTSKTDFAVSYADSGAANTALFISNFSAKELSRELIMGEQPQIRFNFDGGLSHSTHFTLTQVMGMSTIPELDSLLINIRENWQGDVNNYQQRVMSYALENSTFTVSDPALQETIHWSKALQATNRHYIDGRVMPMPCPAEYNFFFTHDMLLTGQGVVNYDLEFLQKGFRFLLELAQEDQVLPHAYYWREGQFVTEYCNSDNWNHLWFIISAASYLKHSGDVSLVDSLYPMLEHSLELMSENLGDDGLMYAQRPDWWDIGHVYGARSYTTILMSKALQDFVYISASLKKDGTDMLKHLALAQRLKQELVSKLWYEEAGYLLNILDQDELDTHYYTGSMLAVVYDMLDYEQSAALLNTVSSVLLDEQLGVRNAMPPDFHLLGERYHFQGNEVGDKWVYFNGGVWPQGNAWYVKALHANGQAEMALSALKKYMTISGILDSPNGLPSFYEYRRTDPESPRYGEIDKPSFLWAGGFFLQGLYQLSGVREDNWNQYLDVSIPKALSDAEFDLSIKGKICRIQNQGSGAWFERIEVDGKQSHSAVITQSAREMLVKRGKLLSPYLAGADCRINSVSNDSKRMSIEIEGISGQTFKLVFASPKSINEALQIGNAGKILIQVSNQQDGYYEVQGTLDEETTRIELIF